MVRKFERLMNTLLIMVILSTIGVILCRAQDASVIRKPVSPGTLVDIGGHRLHFNCLGEGTPLVILESGAGDFSFDWSLAQPGVSKFTRVCSYDRAGYAWSDSGPMPRTMQQIVNELHAALEKLGERPPYVLVGHSLGGLLIREFARRYPNEAGGIVLVDASHEDQLIEITNMKTKRDTIVQWRQLSRGRPIPPIQFSKLVATSGSVSQTFSLDSFPLVKQESPFDKLPLNVQRWRTWAKSQNAFQSFRFSEFDFLPEELELMHSGIEENQHPLGNIPVIVLTGGYEYDGTDSLAKARLVQDHERLQADLATLSTNSKRIIAKKSGHHIQMDEPALVIDTIQQVVQAIREHRELK